MFRLSFAIQIKRVSGAVCCPFFCLRWENRMTQPQSSFFWPFKKKNLLTYFNHLGEDYWRWDMNLNLSILLSSSHFTSTTGPWIIDEYDISTYDKVTFTYRNYVLIYRD